jgi:hypothetical protein
MYLLRDLFLTGCFLVYLARNWIIYYLLFYYYYPQPRYLQSLVSTLVTALPVGGLAAEGV